MTRQLSLFSIVALALLLLLPRTTQAQVDGYETSADFDVAWTLDPREFPDLFTHGPGFGLRGVQTGMDLDGDGNKEILFTTDETLAPLGPDPGFLDVFLYENNGDNNYEYVWSWSYDQPSNSYPPLAWGDIDDDGLNEIYMGIPTCEGTDPNNPCSPPGNATKLFVFEQDQAGVFPDEPTATWDIDRDASLDFQISGLQLADTDGDDQKELVLVSRKSGRRELVVAAPLAGLDAFTTWAIEFEAGEEIVGQGGAIYDVDVEDFDGDGNMEIWVHTWDLLTLAIFEATAPDTYELQADINDVYAEEGLDYGSYAFHDYLFADVDGDGHLEYYLPAILTSAEDAGALFFLDDTDDVSTITGEDFVRVATWNFENRGGDIGDIDEDGLWDIVIPLGDVGEGALRVEYQGEGSPEDSLSYTWTRILDAGFGSDEDPNERFWSVSIGDDLDGDGFNEVVLANLRASEEGQALVTVLEYNGTVTATEESDVPEGYVLEQNYPNPFNPSTSISYVLPQGERVSLKVYNLTGQLVRTLLSGAVQPGGRHTATWNGRDDAGAPVASGVYVYTLEAGAVRISKQMVLLK